MWDLEAQIFVHQNLLEQRSPFFRTLIEDGEVRDYGPVTIQIPDLPYEACTMFVQWLYGKPLCAGNNDPEGDLGSLVDLYDLAFVAGKTDDAIDDELVDASLNAIIRCLAQNNRALRNPIQALESALLQNVKFPGRAAVLEQLVYGECAANGRTKTWLSRSCQHDWHKTEVVRIICMEFAKKACERN